MHTRACTHTNACRHTFRDATMHILGVSIYHLIVIAIIQLLKNWHSGFWDALSCVPARGLKLLIYDSNINTIWCQWWDLFSSVVIHAFQRWSGKGVRLLEVLRCFWILFHLSHAHIYIHAWLHSYTCNLTAVVSYMILGYSWISLISVSKY